MAHGQGTVPFYVRTRQAGERHHSDPNGLLHLLVPLVVQTPTPPAPAAATPPPRSRMFAHVFVLGGCARPRAVPTSSKRRNWARFELFTPCRRRRAIWFGRVGVSPLWRWGPLEGRGRRVPTLCRRMHRPSTSSVARAWPNCHSHHQRDGAYPGPSYACKERARNRKGAAGVRLSSGTCLSSPLPDPEIWLEIPAVDGTTHHAPQ